MKARTMLSQVCSARLAITNRRVDPLQGCRSICERESRWTVRIAGDWVAGGPSAAPSLSHG